MARNKARTLWTAVITAILALFTALGFVTGTASAAVPQTESTCNSTPSVAAPTMSRWARAHSRSLPPTMKQRIQAEAHGTSPSCRHRAPAEPLTESGYGNAMTADTATAPMAGP